MPLLLVALAAFLGGARAPVLAQSPVMTVITGESVDVFAGPSTTEPVVGRVRRSDVVFVFEARESWARIEFNVSGDEWSEGWVERDNVRLKGRTGASSSSPSPAASPSPAFSPGVADVQTNEYGATFTLNLDDAGIRCRSDAAVGYDNCDVDFRVSATTNYNGARIPRIRYRCSTAIVATNVEGGETRTPVSGLSNVYARDDDDRLTVNVNLYPTVRNVAVEMTDIGCEIREVAE